MRPVKPEPPKVNALLGVGLDNTDGETRLTRGKNFTLVGGSQETHAVMQETALKVNEQLDRKGKSLGEVAPAELRDMIMEITDKIGVKKNGRRPE
ncbi:MAG: hypothetical protein IK105_02485 [Thermoguttaceae bacterium]|nr:hypothetical protein [Thermoguttaceae bacterium]MCR5358605.1 hypothetical protein [Thermoguttaceae bacterium]